MLDCICEKRLCKVLHWGVKVEAWDCNRVLKASMLEGSYGVAALVAWWFAGVLS